MNKHMTTLMILATLSTAGLAARAGDACCSKGQNLVLAAADGKSEQKHAPAQAAPAKDDYPTDLCVVSGDKLDSMDDLVKYAYKSPDGKEREVRFCCKDCIKKFKKDPEKYLKMLDEVAAKKAGKPEAK